MLVAGVRGSVSNVVGLPLAQLHELMTIRRPAAVSPSAVEGAG